MRAYILGGLIVAGLVLTGGRMMAHHSFAAEFDGEKRIKLTGTVTKVEWTNPHVWFYFNVKEVCEGTGPAGRGNVGGGAAAGAAAPATSWKCAPADTSVKAANWGAEMGPPHGLQRRGWRRETLKLGDSITVEGSMAKSGAQRMNASRVTLTATGGRPGETLDAASSQGGAVID
jgi:hypothetical protein